jgi:TonB family protein
MNRPWNFKLFISISLGFHFFVFSLLSILLPDFRITQLPPLNIEVSLLPLVKEEREPIRKAEDKYKVRSSAFAPIESGQGVQSEEREALKRVEEKQTEIKSEPSVISHEERKAPQVEKMEVVLPRQEQEPVPIPPVQSEMKIVSVTEPRPSPSNNEKIEIGSQKEEKVVLASLGNPVPLVNPSEKSWMGMKSPSLSESEIVSAKPKYAENPKPLYPQEARKKGYEGEVLLRVEVLSSGRVGEIEVKRSSGHEVLDRSAISAVKQWRFIPAKKGETPIPVWVNIPVAFQLR